MQAWNKLQWVNDISTTPFTTQQPAMIRKTLNRDGVRLLFSFDYQISHPTVSLIAIGICDCSHHHARSKTPIKPVQLTLRMPATTRKIRNAERPVFSFQGLQHPPPKYSRKRDNPVFVLIYSCASYHWILTAQNHLARLSLISHATVRRL